MADAQERSRNAWSRFFARTVDGLFLILVSYMFGSAMIEGWVAVVLHTIMLLALCPLEAWFISRWGMTPGKWVFRVRIVHRDNRLLTYNEALGRAFKVLASGMALGLPFLQVLFNVLAYRELVDTGNTSWDRAYSSQVQHAPMRSIHRSTAIAIGIFMFLFMMSVANV